MFLGCYRYEGDPAPLLRSYEQLVARFDTDQFTIHACAVDEGGITVLDACPDEATFRSFSTSPDWLAACAAAGQPPAVVTPIGEVHRVHAREVVPS
jgi:hypothetical protein